MRLLRVPGAVAALVLCAGALTATHHSFSAEFDANKPIQLRGTVAKVEWINPHTWIHIDVKEADGTTTRWMIEGGTPNTLLRRGLTRDSLPIGTEIMVDGWLARDGSRTVNGRTIKFADGREILAGTSNAGAQ